MHVKRMRIFVAILTLVVAVCLPGLSAFASVAAPVRVSGAAPASAQDWENFDGWKYAETLIPVRDGSALAADVYLPSADRAYPVILIQTPYSKDLYRRAGRMPALILSDTREYAYVILDWRGKFKSLLTAKPASVQGQLGLDGYDAVEWIAQQPWCTGKVGTHGGSALGNVQYLTAAQKPPHLVAASPQVYNIARDYSFYYNGGVARKAHIENYAGIGFPELTAILKEHPFDDGSYDQMAADPGAIEVPLLLVGGWYDFHDMLKAYQVMLGQGNDKVKDLHRVLMGPWIHGGIARDVVQGQLRFPSNAATRGLEEQRRFFDHWLRGIDNGEERSARVTYYVMGQNEWRTADKWPPPGATVQSLYLAEGGRLATAPPSEKTSAASFVSDPNNPVPTRGGVNLDAQGINAGPYDQAPDVESHPDVLVYTTGILERDVALAGAAKAILYISSDQVDTDVAIRLTDVYPDGRSMLVADSIQRMSMRESLAERRPLTPGEIYSVTIGLPDTAITFPAGHRIRVSVSSSNYPRFALNTNTLAFDDVPVLANNRLYHDQAHPSAVILPVLSASAAASAPSGPVTVEIKTSKEGTTSVVDIAIRNNSARRVGGFDVVATLPEGSAFLSASPPAVFLPPVGSSGPRVAWSQPAGLDPGQTARGYQLKLSGAAGVIVIAVDYWGETSGRAASSAIIVAAAP